MIMTKRIYKNYDCNIDNMQSYLDMYGIAVIPNIFSQDEMIKVRTDMFNTLEHMMQKLEPPFKQNNESTWKQIHKMKPLHGMLFQSFGIGHSQFAWNIRQDPRIADIFAKLWHVKPEELLSSFDGVSIGLPPEITNIGFHKKDWYHCDQSFSNSNLHTIQGLVNCYDINDNDGTLTILEGSNKYHELFATTFNKKNNYSDWNLLNEKEQKFYINKGCNITFVKCTAGSLVLWDSRTIHAGSGPLPSRKLPSIRLVIYVCQKPKSYISSSSLIKKKQAFRDMILTSHDPCKIKLFQSIPRFFNNENKIILPIKPILSKLGQSLAGFDESDYQINCLYAR